MSDTWTVHEHKNGMEERPTPVFFFQNFEAAVEHLKARKAVVEMTRIMGPQDATDEQRRMIVEMGGVPTF